MSFTVSRFRVDVGLIQAHLQHASYSYAYLGALITCSRFYSDIKK
jgi:hypothetical protein